MGTKLADLTATYNAAMYQRRAAFERLDAAQQALEALERSETQHQINTNYQQALSNFQQAFGDAASTNELRHTCAVQLDEAHAALLKHRAENAKAINRARSELGTARKLHEDASREATAAAQAINTALSSLLNPTNEKISEGTPVSLPE